MKKRMAILLVWILVLSLSLVGCGGNAPAAPVDGNEGSSSSDGDVIKIGIFEPVTGAYAAGGELEVEGIRLANELYPEVLGKKVELVLADNKSDVVEAAAMIAPGGPLSAEAVSDQLVDFAKAISGGDIEKLDKLKGAIEQGFKEAEKILGELPEVSKETYRLTMEKLDQWAAESSSAQE